MDAPTLVVVRDQGTPVRIPITTTLVIGRDPANQVTIDDGYLSRRHCAVAFRNNRVLVRDMDSYNGTYINGQKIHEECYILPGDVLKMGRTRMFVDFGDVQAQSANLKIYTPNLAPKTGVKPVPNAKPPQLAAPYAGISSNVPPFIPNGVGESSSYGPSTRAQQRRISPDDKTPIPPSAVEDSAAVRSSSRGSRSEQDRNSMRVVAQITRVLSNISDLHEFFDYVLARILSVIPAERGCILRLGPERKGLYPECARSALPERPHAEALRLGISHTIARKVINERVSVLVNDAVIDQRFKHASSVQDLQIRSILVAPLWLGERILGLIYLDHMMHAYAFSEGDRDLLVAAANIAALGLERAMG